MITEAIASLFRGTSAPRVYASLENPNFNLNDPAAFDYLGGASRSASGVMVSHEGSLGLAAVWQAVSLISGDVAKLPLYPYLRLEDDDREIDDNHRAYTATSVRWNKWKSAFLGWRDLMVHSLLWGNGYAYISKSSATASLELYCLLPDRTAPEWIKVGDRQELVYVTEVDGKLRTLMPSEVLHVRGMSVDGLVGCDLVRHARDSWGLALAAQNFASKFFKNGARMGGTLELPAAISKPARDTVEEGFRKTYEEGDNPFKTVILREGAKFHAGQVTPQQGQITELRDTQKREVASYFNIPPSKLGIRDSVSYNSFEQDNLSYLHGCLHHWLATICAEANMKLLTEPQITHDTHYFEHNVSKFLQADWKTLNEGLEIMRRNEIISADEWRRKLNMNKRPDGKGGEYVNPNTRSAKEATEKPEEKSMSAHRDLLVNTLGRVARRVGHDAKQYAKTPAKFAEWSDGGASEHRRLFEESVMPVVAACVSVFGGDVVICQTACGAFFDCLLPEVSQYMEPPHTADELADNVTKVVEHFERTAPLAVASTIMEGLK